jgi:hypothetical protein
VATRFFKHLWTSVLKVFKNIHHQHLSFTFSYKSLFTPLDFWKHLTSAMLPICLFSTIKMQMHMLTYSLGEIYQHFGETCCFHLPGIRLSWDKRTACLQIQVNSYQHTRHQIPWRHHALFPISILIFKFIILWYIFKPHATNNFCNVSYPVRKFQW